MLPPQASERSRSPVQMSPLLAQLVAKHGEESQKLISQVIYKYAKKGLKLRDLSVSKNYLSDLVCAQFEKVDREVIQCIQKGGMSEASSQLQVRSALRKGPRNSGDSQVQFSTQPEIILPHTTRNNLPKKLLPLNRIPSPPRQNQNDKYQQNSLNGYPKAGSPPQKFISKRSSSVAVAEPGLGQREANEFHYPEGRYNTLKKKSDDTHHLVPRFANGPLGNDGHSLDRKANNTLILENQAAKQNRMLITTPPQQRYGKGSGNSPPRSPNQRNQSAALPGNDGSLPNQFTAAQDIKPYPSRRDHQVNKANKKYNMWDMLTLQDTLKKQQEDKAVKEIESARKAQMKAYLDMQIAQKKQIQAQEGIIERGMRDQVDQKVRDENVRDDHISVRHAKLRKEVAAENIENRREKFDLVKQRNDWIKQQFIAKKQQDDATLAHYRQYVSKVKSDKKVVERVSALKQMEGNQERIAAVKVVEREKHLKDLVKQDNTFAHRERNLNSHLQTIQQRDAKLEQHFASPDIVTHAKNEVHKNAKVEQMQKQMAQIEAHREFELERQRLVRMQSLKSEMMNQNANLLHLKAKNKELNAAQHALENVHCNEKMMNTPRKSIGGHESNTMKSLQPDAFTNYNGNKAIDNRVTTRRQANHEMDMHQYQMVAKEKQRLLKELLDHQVEQKAIAKEKERLYKDDKELATSKQMLKQISPRIAQVTAVTVNPNRPLAKIAQLPEAHKKGHPMELGRDEALLAKEVNRLYQMVNGQQK